MTDCVIQADYVNWRTVVGRKCLQLIFEIDISQQGEVLRLLGAPASDKSVPCAIALLDLKPKAEGQAPLGAAPPKKFYELPASQQCAIICADPEFWRYYRCADEADATQQIKAHLRIKSRKELDTDPVSAERWSQMLALFRLHQQRVSPLRGAK